MTTTARPSRSEVEIENPVGSNAMRRGRLYSPGWSKRSSRPSASSSASSWRRACAMWTSSSPAAASRRPAAPASWMGGSRGAAGARPGSGGLGGRFGRRRLDGRGRRGRASMRATGPGRCTMTAASTCTTRGAAAMGSGAASGAAAGAGAATGLRGRRAATGTARRARPRRPARRAPATPPGPPRQPPARPRPPPRRRGARHRRAEQGCALRSSRGAMLAWPHVALLDLDAGGHLRLRARRHRHRHREACLDCGAMFASIVVGTDGSQTAREAVSQAVELARRLGARLDIVSAYEPVPAGRLREEAQQVPEDLQWMVNAREDVDATLRDAAAQESEAAGVADRDLRAPGRSGRRHPRRRRGARRRPHRRRQQGHDRRQALPARLGAEQGQPPRALQRADHPDDLTGAEGAPAAKSLPLAALRRGPRRPSRAASWCRAGRRPRRRAQPRSSGRGPGRRGREPCRSGAGRSAGSSGAPRGPSTRAAGRSRR